MKDVRDLDRVYSSGMIRRYHNVPDTGEKQTVGNHTWGAMAIAHYITAGQMSKDMYEYLLFHDCPEIFTGDTPAYVKWASPRISQVLNRFEEMWCKDNDLSEAMYEIDAVERVICKMCDTLELIYHCRCMMHMGNSYYEVPYRVAFKKFGKHFFTTEDRMVLAAKERYPELAFRVISLLNFIGELGEDDRGDDDPSWYDKNNYTIGEIDVW